MNDRARVPFALVGVLLLVGGAGMNATLGGTVQPSDSDAERAVEQATAAARTALESAAVEAGRRAAAEPVVAPANTSAGELVGASTPFRDYLRILVYRHARKRLAAIGERAGRVTATVSVPPARSVGALERARRRVRVARVGPNGTGLRVRIENVTVTIRREGRVVDRFSWNATVVAATPVLAVHDRVSRFEARLNAGPTEPGLGRRLTARLYAVAWARGYAQYGGAPIANVVANRHVGLLTNGAALAVQESTLGASDPDAHEAVRRRTARVATQDVLAGAGVDPKLSRAAFGAASSAATEYAADAQPVEIRVGATADAAFERMLDEGTMEDAVRSAYTAEARLVARVETIDVATEGRQSPPGEWRLVDSQVRTDTVVRAASGSSVPIPSERGGWHRLRTERRLVERERVVVRRWRRESETETTRWKRTTTYRVGLAVLGRHAADGAPERPVVGVHRAGSGALDGPNLADVRERAVSQLVDARGGPDALASRAVTGDLETDPRHVEVARPAGLRNWVYRDVAALRERLRNVSVRVERGALGTFEANPPARLAEAIERERASLLGAPTRYDGVADRARVAARAAYLDAVLAELRARSEKYRERRKTVDDRLPTRLDGIRRARHRVRADSPPSGGVGGPLDLAVRGAPAALDLTGDDPSMAARNVNYFAVPYGDAADTVVDAVLGPRRVSLRTAARTLQAADRVAEETNGTVRRRALREAVREATTAVEDRLRTPLAKEGIGDSRRERRAVVTTVFGRRDSTAARALAAANGSVVPEIVRIASERYPEALDGQRERDLLALRLRQALRAELRTPQARPRQPLVSGAADRVRSVASKALTKTLGRASDEARKRWGGEVFGSLPAGLPLAPVPGYWYATANVWDVDVRGQYERFVVRSRRGAPEPGTPGGLSYVRDGGAVSLDVDGDGTPELLGHARRVSFNASTAVVVVVPPGRSGVGDTGGNADERSAGWETM